MSSGAGTSRRVAATALVIAGLVLAALALYRFQDSTGHAGDSMAVAGEASDGSASPEIEEEIGEDIAEVVAGESAAEISPQVEERFARVVASMWWHLPRFEKLGLSAEQVSRMDGLCLDMLRRRLALRRAVRSRQPGWREALSRLDLDLAERRLRDIGGLAAELAVIEEQLVLDVLSLLERHQLEALRSDHPAILQRPWFKSLGRGTGAPPPGRGPRDAADGESSRGDTTGRARSRGAS